MIGLQLPLFAECISVRTRRRFAGDGSAPARFRAETLTGRVVSRLSTMFFVQFDGKRVDGSARGCLLQLTFSVWSATSSAMLLLSAMHAPEAPRG